MMNTRIDRPAPQTSLEVRERLVEALKLDLVGPWAEHPLAEEKLPGRVRPSNWYLTGFLIPSGTPPEKSGDVDEDDDVSEIPETGGLAEESNEDRKAAKKGFFPSSMGLSFLVPMETQNLQVTVRWGDYFRAQFEDEEGKKTSVWQRKPQECALAVALPGKAEHPPLDVSNSGGLQLHVIERAINADGFEKLLPPGTRSVSLFLVNHRAALEEDADAAFVFQPEIDVRSEQSLVPRPNPNTVHLTIRMQS